MSYLSIIKFQILIHLVQVINLDSLPLFQVEVFFMILIFNNQKEKILIHSTVWL